MLYPADGDQPRADAGLAGSNRRFILTVGLLVILASLPAFAAFAAGAWTLVQAPTHLATTPFIAQPSRVPVVIVGGEDGRPAGARALVNWAHGTDRATLFVAVRDHQRGCAAKASLSWRPFVDPCGQ